MSPTRSPRVAGLCDPDAVRSIVADGYRAVAELVDDGARFDESAPGGGR